MKLDYGLYMAEAGGYLNTRESKLQKLIKTVKAYPDGVMPNLVFYAVCEECGIATGSITEAEMTRIQNAIKGQPLKISKIFDIINT